MGELKELSEYLGELLAKAGPDDDTPGDVYQKKCAKEFRQEFDNDDWDDWFDKEIEKLENEADKRDGRSVGGKSNVSLWERPSDAQNKELKELSEYLGELLAKAGPDDDTPGDVYQKKMCQGIPSR